MPLEQERTHQSSKRYCFIGSMSYEGLLWKLRMVARIATGHKGIHTYFVEGKSKPLLSYPTFNVVWQPDGIHSLWTQGMSVQRSEVESNSFVVHVRTLQLQFQCFPITSCTGQAHDWSLWFTETKRSSIFQLWFWSKVGSGSFTFLHSEKANNYWKPASCIFYFF